MTFAMSTPSAANYARGVTIENRFFGATDISAVVLIAVGQLRQVQTGSLPSWS